MKDILSMLTPVKSTKDSYTLLIKGSITFSGEMRKIAMEKDDTEKLKLLKGALVDIKALRSAANKIPNDGITDHMWRLMTKAWWTNYYNYEKALDNDSLNTMSKDGTIKKFDTMISYIEGQIEKLENAKKEEST
ncbi:MAG: hypothetical protein K2F99_03335 [Muribaculaceae bacterium]|nr:hypothetical protein [Muribaculaceae bacterium]